MTGVAACLLLAQLTLGAAQDDLPEWPTHAVSLNIGRATPILKAPKGTYPLTGKWFVASMLAIRVGARGKYQRTRGGGLDLDLSLGVEQGWRLSASWRLFAGVDGSFAIITNRGSNKRFSSYGLSPVLGATFMVDDHFSVGTEVKLFALYNVYRDPDAFSRTANSEDFEVRLGSIGLLLVGFHF